MYAGCRDLEDCVAYKNLFASKLYSLSSHLDDVRVDCRAVHPLHLTLRHYANRLIDRIQSTSQKSRLSLHVKVTADDVENHFDAVVRLLAIAM